jgi:methylated-DNA-[protein]-cysteine S-methyltransferase
MIYQTFYTTPFGKILLRSNDDALLELRLPTELNKSSGDKSSISDSSGAVITEIKARLDAYFDGKTVRFDDLALQPSGTPFQRQVWRQLALIPYGQISSYGEIAQAIDNPKAVRAVGGAVGANPIAILLPCHRVLGRDRSLTGFSGGLAIKRTLLAIENISYKGQTQQQQFDFD